MSRSESDDDEFESADEGEESTEESCSVDGSTSNEKELQQVIQPECINAKEDEEIMQDDKWEPPLIKVEATKHSENSAIIQVDCSSSKELPKCEEVQAVSLVTGVKLENNDIPNIGFLPEQKSTEDVKINQQEEIIPAFELPINQIIDVKNSELKADDETAVSTELPCENLGEVPSEIVTKLSTTRSIPNRGKIRSKPSLGAKKLGLGAVKLNQTPESLIPALAKLDSKESSGPSDYQTTPKQVKLHQLFF